VALGWCSTGVAQQFGQWSWNAEARLRMASRDNLLDGESVTTYEQLGLHLNLGVGGFIIHPAIARFHLGLSGNISQYENGRSLDSTAIGGRGELSLFPKGVAPTKVFFALRQYAYGGARSEESGLAETGSTWGVQTAIRRGFLSGLQVGTTFTTTDLAGYDQSQTSGHDFLDWSGSSRKVSHHYRLERRHQDYVLSNYTIGDYTMTMGEHGVLGENWRWDLSAVAMRRSLEVESGEANDIDTMIARNRLTRSLGNGHHLSLNAQLGFGRSTQAPERWSSLLAASYLHNLSKGWQLGPSVSYLYEQRGDATAQAPQAGIDASWNGTRGSFDLGFRSRVHFGQYSLSETGEPSTSTTAAGVAIAVSAAHGTAAGLRKELTLDYAFNDVGATGDELADLPDLGAGFGGAGTEHRMTARLHLSHRRPGFRISTHTELSQRQSSEELNLFDYEAQVATQRLILGWGRFDISAEAGLTEATQATTQQVTSVGGGIHFRPWRFMTLTGSYRNQTREANLAPDVDSDRMEVVLDLRLGLFNANARVYEINEVLVDGSERTNRGIIASISRRFGGWLPIVSAPQRRGEIR
jgi:hypothetical protein